MPAGAPIETLNHCPACERADLGAFRHGHSECQSCGLVFANPRPTLAAIAEYYSRENKYDHWLAQMTDRQRLWQRRFRKFLGTARGGSVFDVGAGLGEFLAVARSCFQVFGSEISDRAIAIAQQRFGLSLVHGDLQALNLAPESFDNMTLFHVLEHLPSPKVALGLCRDSLKTGGTLTIAVPNSLESIPAMIKGPRVLPVDLQSCEEVHLSYFTEASLEKLVKSCGLGPVSMGLDPYFAAHGIALLGHTLEYAICSAVYVILRKNTYRTIWLTARKA